MISIYSAAYDGIREAWDVYVKFAQSITPRDIIPLLAPCSIAFLAFLQWRINLENSRRYFSEKLLEYLAPVQAAQRKASRMLSAQRSYDKNLELNRFSEGYDRTPFMMRLKDAIKQHASGLDDAMEQAYDALFKLSLFLGLHRSETPTVARRLAKDIHDKAFELLTYAAQCKTEIIEHGHFEINGESPGSIIGTAPDEALAKLRRLDTELINLLTSQYKVTNI